MKILSIRFELIKPGPRTFTCKATLVNEALQSVDAHGSGTSIEQAEEDATTKAISRGERMFGIRIVGFQEAAPHATPPDAPQKELHHSSQTSNPPLSTGTSEVTPPPAQEESPPSSTVPTHEPEPGPAPESQPDTASAPSEEKRRANATERLYAVCSAVGASEEALRVVVKPHVFEEMNITLFEAFVDQMEAGPTDDDRTRSRKHCTKLESADTIDTLKSQWEAIHNAHWGVLSWQARLLVWNCKEQRKRTLLSIGAQPLEQVVKCRCGAPVKQVRLKSGGTVILNAHSYPTMMQGEGVGEKRYVQISGVWEEAETWPAVPGQRGSVSAYTEHSATCPHTPKHP